MEIIFFVISTLFIFLGIFWIIKINFSYNWIKKNRNNFNNKIKQAINNSRFFVILPVLNEEKRIEDTIKYFSKIKEIYKIAIITTEKEDRIPQSRNTIEIANQLVKKYPNLILIFHYPRIDGKMVNQINFGIKSLIKKIHVEQNDYFAIYNADSNPDHRTFKWISCQDKNKCVFQQYGDYRKNIANIVNNPILSSAIDWQNRWSIGFELFNAINSVNNKNLNKKSMNYCIGHGLFLNKKIYEKIGGLNESTHNEDALLGLEFSYLSEKINPIPYFDLSDTPDTITELYRQKFNWFFGPFQSFQYFSILKNKYCLESKGIINLFILSLKLFCHSVYWICGSTLLIILFVLPFLLEKEFLLILSIVTYLIFLVIPNIYSCFVFRKLGNKTDKIIQESFNNLCGNLFFYGIHGLSAYASIFQQILSLINGSPVEKRKTKMIN